METNLTVTRHELLQVADTVARDKGIERDEVLEAMEQAIQKAGRSKYGQEHDIRAEIDRKSGEIRLLRFREVADPIENEFDPDPARRGAARCNPEPEDRRLPDRRAAAHRFRPHRRADRQAGHRAEGARRRAPAPVRGVQGPHRRDRQRPGQARRVRQCHRRSRPRRGDPAPRRAAAARDLPRRASACAPISTTCARSSAARRSSCRAPIRNSWPSCSPRKCRRSMTASSRSGPWRAIPAAGPRSPSSPTTAASIPVGACVGMRGSRVQAVVGELQGEKIDIIPVVGRSGDLRRQRAGPGRSRQGRAGRGAAPHRGGGARRSAEPRHRPARPECAPGLAAHRLGHRHPDRGRGIRAPHRGVPHPLAAVHRRARRRRRHRPSAGDRRLHLGRGSGLRAARGPRRDRGLRRGRRERAARAGARLPRRPRTSGSSVKRRGARRRRRDRRDRGPDARPCW